MARFRATVLVAAAGLLAVACRSSVDMPEKGAILLKVEIPTGEPIPDELRAFVYDASGILFSGVRLPGQGAPPPPSGASLGTILLQPGSSIGSIRIHLRGFAAGIRRSDGVVTVAADMRALGRADVEMTGAFLIDGDGDDVPDAIDDCLGVFNPEQGGCPLPGAPDGATASGDASSEGSARDGGGNTAERPAAADGSSSQDSSSQDIATGNDRGAGTGGGTGGATQGTGGGTQGTGGTTQGTGGAANPPGPDAGAAGAPAGGSPGCGVAPTGMAEDLVTLMMIEGGVPVGRQFQLSRPADYTPQRAYRLVVGLGSPATAPDAIRAQLGVQGAAVTTQPNEIFLYPLARTRTFGTWGTKVGWQLGAGARNTNAAGLDDVAFVDAMLDDVMRRHCIDKSRVFVVGHGWGSDFAHALACVRGDRIRAVMGSANNGDYYLLNPVVGCAGLVNTWTLNGKSDPQLSLATGMTTLDYWLGKHACSRVTQPIAVVGPSGNEDCVRYTGCTSETRWCAYDSSFGGGVPSYLGREALNFFRGF